MSCRAGRLACCGVAAALLSAAVSAFLLTGCGPGVMVDGSSPQALVDQASITSSPASTEEGQWVELSVPLDAPVTANGDVSDDVVVTVDGAVPDGRALAVSVRVEEGALKVTLLPGSQAGTTSSGTYFACYQGHLALASARDDGALPHVRGEAGATALLPASFDAVIPSGMALEEVRATDEGQVVRVATPAQIRCCTWFELGGQRFFQHHHEFLRETPASCATALADALNASVEGYEAVAQGDEVTVRRTDAACPAPRLRVIEGVGA